MKTGQSNKVKTVQQVTSLFRGRITVFFVTLLTALGTARARDGRDFAGFYSVDPLGEQGTEVRVTLSLHIYNYSGADVTQAAIMLHESGPGLVVYGGFSAIKLLHDRQDVKVRRQFTIPKREYQLWQTGIKPNLFITYQDSLGKKWERTIELSRRPPPFPF